MQPFFSSAFMKHWTKVRFITSIRGYTPGAKARVVVKHIRWTSDRLSNLAQDDYKISLSTLTQIFFLR